MYEKIEENYGLFDSGVVVLEKTQNVTKYQIDCNTPDGTMYCYHLFQGIDLAYTTFYANSCFQRKNSLPHIIEIAYCRSGRYECEYKRGFMTYLGENDLAVSIINSQRNEPIFPTGIYEGVALIINTDIIGECFHAPVIGIEIDFAGLIQKFCYEQCCVVMKTPPELLHVFEEICDCTYRGMYVVICTFARAIPLTMVAAPILYANPSRMMYSFQRIHVPKNVLVMLCILIRFFPVIEKEMLSIRNGIRARGIFPTWWSILKNPIMAYECFFVPLTVRCLKLSTELGASAELRGLDSSNPRSCIYNIGFTYKDILAILGFVLGCIGVMLGVRTWLS